MTENHRSNKYTVSLVVERDQMEMYIGKCNLDATDLEILRRRHLRHQSHTQIAMELHMSADAETRHYKKALAALAQIARKYADFVP